MLFYGMNDSGSSHIYVKISNHLLEISPKSKKIHFREFDILFLDNTEGNYKPISNFKKFQGI